MVAHMLAAILASSPAVAQTQPGPASTNVRTARPPDEPARDLVIQPLEMPWFQGTLNEARAEARSRRRLLVLFIAMNGDPAAAAMEERTWGFEPLRAFIQWHAIAVKVDYLRHRALMQQIRLQPRDLPAVAIFHDGELLELMKRQTGGFGVGDPIIKPGGGPDWSTVFFPKPLHVLMQLDLELRMLEHRNPVWTMLHNAQNPPPRPPPDPDPFHLVDDEGGPMFEDPEEAGPAAVLDRLREARMLVEAGALHSASGAYTWLWERGGALDPAFEPARLAILPAEVADLSTRRTGTRERFGEMLDHAARKRPWAEISEVPELFALGEMACDPSVAIKFLDLFLNDLDMSGILPRPERRAYQLLAERLSLGDPWATGKDPVASAMQLIRQCHDTPHLTDDLETFQQALEFFRRFAMNECCRLYAACLRAGRPDDAAKIAGSLMADRPEPLTSVSLVVTALAAEQPRREHLVFLARAAEQGMSRPDLERRIAAALRDDASPSAAPGD